MTTASRPTPRMLAGRPRPPAPTDARPFRQRYEMAIRYSSLDRHCRLVALTIATWASWETGEIATYDRPGTDRIATACGLSDRLTRICINELVTRGYLIRIPAATTAQASHIALAIEPGVRTRE